MSDRYIRAEISKWVADDPQPGLVECRLSDIHGRTHSFVGKYYDFTDQNLSASSRYPRPGYIVCEIISQDERTVEVETDKIASRYAHESVEGLSRFTVHREQLETREISD